MLGGATRMLLLTTLFPCLAGLSRGLCPKWQCDKHAEAIGCPATAADQAKMTQLWKWMATVASETTTFSQASTLACVQENMA